MTQQQTLKPFQSIAETAKLTGISQFSLRKRIREGNVRFTMSGNKYLVNIPDLLKREGLTLADINQKGVTE